MSLSCPVPSARSPCVTQHLCHSNALHSAMRALQGTLQHLYAATEESLASPAPSARTPFASPAPSRFARAVGALGSAHGQPRAVALSLLGRDQGLPVLDLPAVPIRGGADVHAAGGRLYTNPDPPDGRASAYATELPSFGQSAGGVAGTPTFWGGQAPSSSVEGGDSNPSTHSSAGHGVPLLSSTPGFALATRSGQYSHPDPASGGLPLLSPIPGGALADLLLATSVRRVAGLGHQGDPRGASPTVMGSKSGFGLGAPDSSLPELGSPTFAAPLDAPHARHAFANGEYPAGEVQQPLATAVVELNGLSMDGVSAEHSAAWPSDAALRGSSPAAGGPLGVSPGAPGARVRSNSILEYQPGPQPSATLSTSGSGGAAMRGEVLSLLSPAEQSMDAPASGDNVNSSPDHDPDLSAVEDATAAWAGAWAQGVLQAGVAAGQEGGAQEEEEGALLEVGAGQDLAGAGQGLAGAGQGLQTLRGSLESSRSLSPRLMLTFEAALAEVDAWDGPSAATSPAAQSGFAVGSSAPAPQLANASAPQALPDQAPANLASQELMAGSSGSSVAASSSMLGSGRCNSPNPGGSISAPMQLRRSLEAVLAAAGRDAGASDNELWSDRPLPSARSLEERHRNPGFKSPAQAPAATGLTSEGPQAARTHLALGLGMGSGSEISLALSSPPPDTAPSSAQQRYSPVEVRTPGGSGPEPLWAPRGHPGTGLQGTATGPQGGAGLDEDGSPIAAAMSPATVQRRSYYNSVVLAEAEEGYRETRSGGSLSDGWRAVLFDGAGESDEERSACKGGAA